MERSGDLLKSRRLSRRLLILFLTASVVPVALSDWLSTAVTGQLADRLAEEHRARGTRQVSRQILDRLVIGRTVLLASGSGLDGARVSEASMQPFLAIDRDSDGRQAVEPSPAAAWRAAPAAPTGGEDRAMARSPPVELRIVADAAAPRILLAVVDSRGLRHVGELNPDFLWAPTRESDEDSEWRVTDGRGRTLMRRQFDNDGGATIVDGDSIRTVSRLFLGAEFATDDWLIERRSPRPAVRWAGLPLTLWLALVATATTLLVVLLARRQIHRALLPLHRLADGTSRLAAGDAGARVAESGDDEIGQLARSFNEMAGRVEERERALHELAHHDSLTALLNRYGLYQALERALSGDAAAATTMRAVITIDLDRFKDVNDSQGHDVGDVLLRQTADRLRALACADTIVARLGGDEFVVVAPCRTESDADALAASVVRALNLPFRTEDAEFLVGASAGVALAPRDGHTREDLLRRADAALYAAKEAGRARFLVFRPELDRAAHDRARVLSELHAAIERREFVPYFQPRVRSSDGMVLSAEALVRWQHPTRGLLAPGAFIELAEQSGLISAIGSLMLEASCAQLATWHARGRTSMRVSVNLSPRQLIDGTLPTHVREMLQRYALPAAALELEVTESVMVGDFESARVQLGELRQAGVHIAMDDFGTGFSSLSALRRLPIDVMKIDRQFVSDLDQPESYAIVRAIITLARELNLRLVAEGVETPSQAAALQALGCDEFQGFLFSKPVSAHDFDATCLRLDRSSGIRSPANGATEHPHAGVRTRPISA